jgi:hypothetical protein
VHHSGGRAVEAEWKLLCKQWYPLCEYEVEAVKWCKIYFILSSQHSWDNYAVEAVTCLNTVNMFRYRLKI